MNLANYQCYLANSYKPATEVLKETRVYTKVTKRRLFRLTCIAKSLQPRKFWELSFSSQHLGRFHVSESSILRLNLNNQYYTHTHILIRINEVLFVPVRPGSLVDRLGVMGGPRLGLWLWPLLKREKNNSFNHTWANLMSASLWSLTLPAASPT